MSPLKAAFPKERIDMHSPLWNSFSLKVSFRIIGNALELIEFANPVINLVANSVLTE